MLAKGIERGFKFGLNMFPKGVGPRVQNVQIFKGYLNLNHPQVNFMRKIDAVPAVDFVPFCIRFNCALKYIMPEFKISMSVVRHKPSK